MLYFEDIENLMQCNVLSSRNSHENIEIMVNSYITADRFF